MIGVLAGTDITNAKYKKWIIFISIEKNLQYNNFRVKIDPLKKYKNAKIFISTDENHINQFKLYGERVIFTDSYRSKSKPIHLGTNNSRKNHKYKLGLEALIDSLLLSESDIDM